jgi:opacity protein-like surface antigen
MMIRRNWKTTVLGAALALALPAVASAQMSRVEGMALQGDFIKDWSGIFTYTSQVANVGNLVYGELGNVTSPPVTFDRSVGAVIGNLWEGRLGTWAIHLREQTPNMGQGDAFGNGAPGAFGTDPNTHTSESIDIMWGKKAGTTSFGLRINRFNGSILQEVGGVTSKLEADFTQPDPNRARNVLGFSAGVGFETSPTSNVEVGLTYQQRTWLLDVPGLRGEEDGSGAYLLAGRAMWQWQPNIMLVPVFKYYNFDLGEKFTAGTTTTTFDNSRSGWQLGAAGNWTLGSNDLFVLGLNFAQNKLKQQEDLFGLGFGDTLEIKESFTPQLFAALETHVNSWLTLRFGANKGAWEKTTIELSNGDKLELTSSTFNMNLGAGLKFGNLQLDAILDNAFPNNLPYFISGDTTTDMFAKVTATYPF